MLAGAARSSLPLWANATTQGGVLAATAVPVGAWSQLARVGLSLYAGWLAVAAALAGAALLATLVHPTASRRCRGAVWLGRLAPAGAGWRATWPWWRGVPVRLARWTVLVHRARPCTAPRVGGGGWKTLVLGGGTAPPPT